jgi:hypothetical protein
MVHVTNLTLPGSDGSDDPTATSPDQVLVASSAPIM